MYAPSHADRLRAAMPAGAEVADDLATRLTWANDASIYRLVPTVVVFPRSAADVTAVLAVARDAGLPVCFRAGGTSLSGQAVTDGILMVVSRHLRRISVSDDASRVTCEPGAVGAWVNAALAPHGRRIGPDPASIQAAEIGGMVANNASGMCCGVAENSYHTVTGLDLVLADGWRIDTGLADADERLRRERPALVDGLAEIGRRIAFTAGLPERIRTAFATKNTVGYSLNAFIDAAGPAQVLQRLVVGSEGTLAFIAGATFRTLPLPRFRATALLLFRDVESAGQAVARLADSGAAAIELMDAVALRRVADRLPNPVPDGEPAALLVEYQAVIEADLAACLIAATPLLAQFDLLAPAAFTRDPTAQARLWSARKGLFPSVGAVRKAGTAVVIEDITFPVVRLSEGVRRLRGLFAVHGYDDAVIFGHAKDGNLHFTLTPDLSKSEERSRYDAFMRELVRTVLDMDGHLKAEHGTGRNMAPFVTAQWGVEAVDIMRAVKVLLDPRGILNPGVLLSDDPEAHLKHLKTLKPADPHIDTCIECGFCEPVCPSRDAALSPRQRIVLMRAAAGGGAEAKAIARIHQDQVLDACAADGMCASACPVGIDTGAMVKAARGLAHGRIARTCADLTERHFAPLLSLTRLGLRLLGGRRLPGRAIPIPDVATALPRRWPSAAPGQPTVVYIPTCLTRTIGPDAVADDLAVLCAAAGIGLVVPNNANGLCCGQPWESKGFPATARHARERLFTAVLDISPGTSGVVVDNSLCSASLDSKDPKSGEIQAQWNELVRWHPAQFVVELLLPRLRGRWKIDTAAVLHPTCSEHKAGWVGQLVCAASPDGAPQSVVPTHAGCCGMAGDRGWSVPGLTKAATQREGAETRALSGQGVTTSTTCGLAVGAARGRPYQHLFTYLRQNLDNQ